MSGLFVTLEGGEGAGKTTVMHLVSQKLASLGVETLCTREPGGIRISEKIREVILDREHIEMDSRTEALLYAAARRQHLVEKVKPAMELGQVVLCDRFVDSPSRSNRLTSLSSLAAMRANPNSGSISKKIVISGINPSMAN